MSTTPHDDADKQELMEEWLTDPKMKELIIQKLGLSKEGEVSNTLSGKAGKTLDLYQHLTLSGMTAGAPPLLATWPMAPLWFPGSHAPRGAQFDQQGTNVPPAQYPFFPTMPSYGFGAPQGRAMPYHPSHYPVASSPSCSRESTPHVGRTLSTSRAAKRPAQLEEISSDESEVDTVHLLDEQEALELVEFDLTVDSSGAWEPLKFMVAFLQKN